jgi:hypothetical protein
VAAEDFGPCRLDALIGQGGMGEVWWAVDTRKTSGGKRNNSRGYVAIPERELGERGRSGRWTARSGPRSRPWDKHSSSSTPEQLATLSTSSIMPRAVLPPASCGPGSPPHTPTGPPVCAP